MTPDDTSDGSEIVNLDLHRVFATRDDPPNPGCTFGTLESVECADCGRTVYTNNPDDVDRCNGCRE